MLRPVNHRCVTEIVAGLGVVGIRLLGAALALTPLEPDRVDPAIFDKALDGVHEGACHRRQQRRRGHLVITDAAQVAGFDRRGLQQRHIDVQIDGAAPQADEDPDRLYRSCMPSGSYAVGSRTRSSSPQQTKGRQLAQMALNEILEERVVFSRGQRKPRGVKR